MASIVEKTYALLADAWSVVRGVAVGFVDSNGAWSPASATSPLPTSSAAAATDRSGTITTGGTAQNAMAANASRRSWTIINTSDTAMRVHAAGTASTTAGVTLNPGDVATGTETNAISVHGATTGKTFTAWEN